MSVQEFYYLIYLALEEVTEEKENKNKKTVQQNIALLIDFA